MKKFLNVFSIFISFLLCFSCSNFSLSEKSAIRITLPAAERAVSSTQPMLFVLTATPVNSKASTTAYGKSGETITLEIEAGTYTVNVKAYAENDTGYKTILFENTEETVKVIANQTTELKLKLKRQIFTVTFIAEETTTQTVNYGEKAKKPENPVKEGSEFLGWYIGDNEYDFATVVKSDLTLTAKWKVNSYTVTFEADETTTQSVNYGEKVTKPENPEKEGYIFLGWYIGDKEYDFTTVVKSDLTLTAKWKIEVFTITFVAEETTTQTVDYGEKVIKPEDPVKKGSVFLGWYNGDKEYDFTTAVKSDLTLTARWKEQISPILSVVFESVKDGNPYFKYSNTDDALKIEFVSEEKIEYEYYIWLVDGVVQTEKTSVYLLDQETIDRLKENEDTVVITCIANIGNESDIYSAKLSF